MFTKKEINLLGEFYHHCIRTSPVSGEEKTATWTQTHWTFEQLENLTLGEEVYIKAPLPTWLSEGSKYRSHGGARKQANHKRRMLRVLREHGELPDNLLVCEVGYGIEIVLAMMIKEWKEIKCYDQCGGFKAGLINFFVKQHGLNLVFEQTISAHFSFDEIEESTMIISNGTHIGIGKPSERIRNNKNLIYLRNGMVLEAKDMPMTTEECRKTLGRGYL